MDLVIGLEVHVELRTRTKMFTRVASPAHPENEDAPPNTLVDPVVLALPGALPVVNDAAIDMSIRVGLALGCSIAEVTRWDRKSYVYPDLPKGYQISQSDLPLCFDGAVSWPIGADGAARQIGIIRAHLEEDAGKLLHEGPGGVAIEHSIVDLNRAGTPLLEIVTAPDFRSADEVVRFAQLLRDVCRFLDVTKGVLQKGHMRFEPNINCILALAGGRRVATPIVEIKNLNSFRALRGAIEHEQRVQPKRWLEDGREMGAGMKSTRGWSEARGVTLKQRDKEDAHDYRYFPDPDLLPLRIARERIDRLQAARIELPHERVARYERDAGLAAKEARALVDEPDDNAFYEEAVAAFLASGGDAADDPAERGRAGKLVANVHLQACRRLANDRGCSVRELGIGPERVAEIALLRAGEEIDSSAVDRLVEHLANRDEPARAAASSLGLLQVRDEAALEAWCDAVIADPAHAETVADVRGGKDAAVGRLIGAVKQASAGTADAKAARAMLLAKLRSAAPS